VSRSAVVVAQPPTPDVAPPGIPAADYGLALVEDTYEAVADLAGVQVLVAVARQEPWRSQVAGLLWPSTPLLDAAGPTELFQQVAACSEDGSRDAVVVIVAGDAPDLPGLVLAKVFSALENVPVAAAPALRGGLVALGARLPAPAWLTDSAIDLDLFDAEERLREMAPPRNLVITRPWRRLRTPADIASLDPGLEGWAATRALLGAQHR
jgi:hypothetical protein